MKSGDRVRVNDGRLSFHNQAGRIVRVDERGWIHLRLDIHKGTALEGQEYGPFIAGELLPEKAERPEPGAKPMIGVAR